MGTSKNFDKKTISFDFGQFQLILVDFSQIETDRSSNSILEVPSFTNRILWRV
jgi:hypothetical protein